MSSLEHFGRHLEVEKEGRIGDVDESFLRESLRRTLGDEEGSWGRIGDMDKSFLILSKRA